MTDITTIAKEYTARIMDRIDILREVENAMRAAQAEMSKAPRSFTEQLYADDSHIPVTSAEAERFLADSIEKFSAAFESAVCSFASDHPPLADESAAYTRISSDEDLQAGRYLLKRNVTHPDDLPVFAKVEQCVSVDLRPGTIQPCCFGHDECDCDNCRQKRKNAAISLLKRNGIVKCEGENPEDSWYLRT